MLYRELIQFEPLDTVVQLRESAEFSEARRLVSTYAVSDRMVEQLSGLVFPQLRLDRGNDNKGLFIVGNYGTGKSHLMAVLASLAERADILPDLNNERMRTEAARFAGSYKVIRMELGAVTRRLYYIITDQIAAFLQEQGIDYRFPNLEEVGENKSGLLEAMRRFNAKYPDHGLLLVVDELLDYLRAQDAAGLNLDLGFLRELGEVTELAPFRFIAGVQESLFDSPSFSFFAQQVQRVRARFDQVRIAREDVAFVVQKRLLAKTDQQIAWITDHLRKFVVLYPTMADRLTEYARLFPIHPAYIEAFEQVYIAEKREVLKTLTAAIQGVLELPVPETECGLISYDHYWTVILNDPSLRSQSGVISVVQKGTTLRSRIESAYSRPNLMAMALRIVDALCVQRLTTADIRTPIGVTADELRDKLCLWTPLPASNVTARFLGDLVKVALKEITRTVSGQYISFNEENGQYYIDPDKDVDVDARIVERSELVSAEQSTQYYFDALRQLFRNLPQSVYVPGYQIWAYELPWSDHKVTRPGYLFFGPPNRRSTAQPPRDFYVYFLSPFAGDTGGVGQTDELIFALSAIDDEFRTALRRYAAARMLTGESTELAVQYADKATGHLRQVRQWLERNLNSKLRVRYRDQVATVSEVLAAMRSTASQDIEEMIRLMAAHLLTPHFQESYPAYPAFARLQSPISEAARPTAAMDAIRFIARGTRTQLAVGVAEGLKLLDSTDVLRPLQSPYARYLLELLESREPMQVVNSGEVIVQLAGGITPIFKDPHFQLEPEWIAVLLVALVADGRIELSPGGTHPVLDAATVESAAMTAVGDLADFRFYKRPRGVPVARWQQIFEGFGLRAALVRDEGTRADGLTQLQALVRGELATVTTLLAKVEGGVTLWNESLFTDRMDFTVRSGIVEGAGMLEPITLNRTDLLAELRAAKQYLDGLTRFTSVGRMQNLALNESQITEGAGAWAKSKRIGAWLELVNQFLPLCAYLGEARSYLPSEDPWINEAELARHELLMALRRFVQSTESFATTLWRQRLDQLKRAYSERYTQLHTTYVLGQSGDAQRRRLLESERAKQFKQLSRIDLFGQAELASWIQAVTAIKVCPDYHAGLIEETPACPRCRFNGAAAGAAPAQARLATLEMRLDGQLSQWDAALRSELAKTTASTAIANMTAAERTPIDAFLASSDPAVLPPRFVESVNQALRGLRGVTISTQALVDALKTPGQPCTFEELESRFAHFVRTLLVQGNDRATTRLTLD